MELIKNHIPEIRFLYDLKDVLLDQEWLKHAPNLQIYYMYRDLADSEKDREATQTAQLRYDITIMEGETLLGREFPKTLGHEHPLVPKQNLTYPEIYEVLEGEAYYLIQKQKDGLVEDIFAVHAKTEEKVLVPPDYGHVTINASGRELKMANWTEKNFQSDYSIFQKKRGACYYALSDGTNHKSLLWQKNDKYQSVPPIKIFEAAELSNVFNQFNLDATKNSYQWIAKLEKLDFLKNPQKYSWD